MALFDGDTLTTSSSPSSGSYPANEGEPTVGIVLDATPFYAEAGGQMADCGRLSVVSAEAGEVRGVVQVADVRMFGGFALHIGRLVSGRYKRV